MLFASTYKYRKQHAQKVSIAIDREVKPNQVRYTLKNGRPFYAVRGLSQDEVRKYYNYLKNGKTVVNNGFISSPVKSEYTYNFVQKEDDDMYDTMWAEADKLFKRKY